MSNNNVVDKNDLEKILSEKMCYASLMLFEVDKIVQEHLKTHKSMFDNVNDFNDYLDNNCIIYKTDNGECLVYNDFMDVEELKIMSESELKTISANVVGVKVI